MPSDDVRHINIDIKKSPLEDNSVPRSILRKITHCEVRYVSCYTYPKKKDRSVCQDHYIFENTATAYLDCKASGRRSSGFCFQCHVSLTGVRVLMAVVRWPEVCSTYHNSRYGVTHTRTSRVSLYKR